MFSDPRNVQLPEETANQILMEAIRDSLKPCPEASFNFESAEDVQEFENLRSNPEVPLCECN